MAKIKDCVPKLPTNKEGRKCMRCGTETAWYRQTRNHGIASVCFDCIPHVEVRDDYELKIDKMIYVNH